MNIEQEKQLIRSQCNQTLSQFPSPYVKECEIQFTKQLLSLPIIQNAKTIFCYVSVGNEAGTNRFIEFMLAKEKVICVPKCLPNRQMQAIPITSLAQISKGYYGLLEPNLLLPAIPPSSIDLIIAPCLACDVHGNRLGHGGGYYDRYLSQMQAPILCLCYEELLFPELPTTCYDIPVSTILTQKQTLLIKQ